MITVYYCRDSGPMMDNPWPNVMGRVPGGQPDVTAADATEAVERWQVAAGEAGDDAMVETCRLTLDGDAAALAAWCECERTADASFSL